MKKLKRTFYNREADIVAKDLLGKLLVRRVAGKTLVGRIVETEAYLGEHDLACHTAKGMTERNRVMFGPAGHTYVYMIYGMYYCTNIVTESVGRGSAVLLRALEPIKNVKDKTSGPGLLSKAMKIDRKLNGCDLLENKMFVTYPPHAEKFIIISRPRIGVDYAGRWAKRCLRFYIKNNPCVSRP